MGKLEPIFAISTFVVFWFLFHIVFLWYNFLVVDCGYYSEFWQESNPLSPIAAFSIGIGLFAVYFFLKVVSTYRSAKKDSFLWLVAFLLPIMSFYGVDDFNQFMIFQDGSVPISEYIDLENLPDHQKFRYELERENYVQNKERLVKYDRYCNATDFYQRT